MQYFVELAEDKTNDLMSSIEVLTVCNLLTVTLHPSCTQVHGMICGMLCPVVIVTHQSCCVVTVTRGCASYHNGPYLSLTVCD